MGNIPVIEIEIDQVELNKALIELDIIGDWCIKMSKVYKLEGCKHASASLLRMRERCVFVRNYLNGLNGN